MWIRRAELTDADVIRVLSRYATHRESTQTRKELPMTSPFADGTPVGDYHHWERPASPPCPNCECCSAALCELAKQKNTACHWEGRHGDFDLSKCPCWRKGATSA